MNVARREGVGEDADPLNDMCDACGAPVAVACGFPCTTRPSPDTIDLPATEGHRVAQYQYTTFEQAQDALAKAEADIAADMGDEAVEAGWSDVVDIVAQDCSPEVRRELRRTTGTEERG